MECRQIVWADMGALSLLLHDPGVSTARGGRQAVASLIHNFLGDLGGERRAWRGGGLAPTCSRSGFPLAPVDSSNTNFNGRI